ncbi:MAG: SDR family oxidoreductase [Deltaproteobacteria bacterium]|nr:SDR family oxidoreductase [Deltaproteobacteria bacterium]
MKDETQCLQGRRALVSGSSRGLGAVIARALAERGAAVVVHGAHASAALTATTSALCDAGHDASSTAFDVGDADAVVLAIDRLEAGRPIDILVHCASQYDTEPIDQLTPERWDAVLQGTLSGTFHLCRTLIPRMRARGWGRVIIMGCVGCDRVYHGAHSVAYRIAVSGNLALTRAYAQTAFADGVTVNLIAPGYLENTQGSIDATTLPAGRFTRSTEILPAVHFLLSDAAAHISGASLNVAGGYAGYVIRGASH